MTHFVKAPKSRIAGQIMLLALTPMLVSGCLSTRTTPTTGLTVERVKTDVCALWTPVSYDSELDTQITVEGNQSLNARRAGFCEGE